MLGLQVRYALITGSLNQMAGNLPPELIEALVQKHIWSPAQGLAYANRIPKPESESCTKLDLRRSERVVRMKGGVRESVPPGATGINVILCGELTDRLTEQQTELPASRAHTGPAGTAGGRSCPVCLPWRPRRRRCCRSSPSGRPQRRRAATPSRDVQAREGAMSSKGWRRWLVSSRIELSRRRDNLTWGQCLTG